jgi:hypothetical protein
MLVYSHWQIPGQTALTVGSVPGSPIQRPRRRLGLERASAA